MLYNISPETLVLNPLNPEEYQKTPLSETKTWNTTKGDIQVGGVYYRKDRVGVLPSLVSDIFQERKMFKTKKKIAQSLGDEEILKTFPQELVQSVIDENGTPQYYDSMQYIRKILINSMYGVLGNQYFNFFNINNAMAVTLCGQELIKYLSNTLNQYCRVNWHKVANKIFTDAKDVQPLKNDVVVLIDTDSVDGSTNISTNLGNVKISDLFEKCDHIKEYDNGKYIGTYDQVITCDSLNVNSDRIERKQINYVMKHKVKKTMFKIKYSGMLQVLSDKEIIITEDHSLMVRRDGKIVEISPKNIKDNDKILIKVWENLIEVDNYIVENLGEQELDVYDIEVEENHNFFGNDILVHNSNYICLDEMIDSLGINFSNNAEFREFTYTMEKKFFKPFFDKILSIYYKKYDIKPIINFKREKIISKKFILAKKKYVDEMVEDDDGNIYDDVPKIHSTGVELVRTDTPIFCRDKIGLVLRRIFASNGGTIVFLREIRSHKSACPLTVSAQKTSFIIFASI
jgi:DNA polymerase elongation subunit (family B)